MLNKWFIIPKPNLDADLRLICFPYAGGGTSIFSTWLKYLPDNIELVMIQAPGRGSRIFEQAYADVHKLVSDLLIVIPDIINKPYILFGHSLGSRIAFELMSQLNSLRYSPPLHFIASGSSGPHYKSKMKPFHHLPFDEFIHELDKLGGTPKAILENKELLELTLPLLRADFQMSDQYRYTEKVMFTCPITVLGGKEDHDISLADLESWGDFFLARIDVHLLEGDHFFIDNNKMIVLQKVNEIIQMNLHKVLF